MYSIKLDENKYFTGSYATVGSIEGGIDIETLPPDMEKALFYKYDYNNVTSIQNTPIINESTNEQEVDADGDLNYKEDIITTSVMEWFFDEEKYNLYLQDELYKTIVNKINEIGVKCKEVIYSGIDITLSDGNTYHFSLNTDDQTNIDTLYNKAKSGNYTYLPYHADKQFCKLFSILDIMSIGDAALYFKTYNTTLCNFLNVYLRTLTNITDIQSVDFTIDSLPEDYKNKFKEFISSLSL